MITPYLNFYHAGSQTQTNQLEFPCDTSNLSWEDLEVVCLQEELVDTKIPPIENLGSPMVEENDDPHGLFFHDRCSKEGDQVDSVEGCKDIKELSKNPPLKIVDLVEGI